MSDRTSTVHIGVVGTSWWAERVHLPSLTSHPRAEVVAISGRDAERAEAVAHRYGIAHVFTDYRAMLSLAWEMTEWAQAKNLTTMTFFTWRWMPQYRYLKQLADGGFTGAPRHAQFTQLAGHGRVGAYAWRFDARRTCGTGTRRSLPTTPRCY